MARLWIQATFSNATQGYIFGDHEPHETDFDPAEIGQLYRSLASEFGRCVSKLYVTTQTEDGIPIGWVFQKRMEYEYSDRLPAANRHYLREVWVSVLTGKPVTVQHSFRIDRMSEVA